MNPLAKLRTQSEELSRMVAGHGQQKVRWSVENEKIQAELVKEKESARVARCNADTQADESFRAASAFKTRSRHTFLLLLLFKNIKACNSFMGRLWYIKAIVVPDGQRRLHCTAAEVPIMYWLSCYECIETLMKRFPLHTNAE